jgi:hypothetical protein
MDIYDVGARLWARAQRQNGLLDRSELVAHGLSKTDIARWLRNGTIVEMLPSLYRLGDVAETWELKVRASVRWGGDEATICSETAAAWQGLKGFARAGTVHLSIPDKAHVPQYVRFPLELHTARVYERSDVEMVQGVRTTRVERTLLDIGDGITEARLVTVIEDALCHKLTTADRIHTCYHRLRGKGRKGVATMGRLLVRRGATLVRTGSPLEADFLRLFHRLKVPIPVAQYGVPPFGEAWYWLDFAYPDLKVAIEIDSEEWHFGDHEVFEADRARWNQLLCWGWRPITFTSRAKHDPGYVDRTVREVLKAAETQRPCAPGECRRLLVGEQR